MSVLRMRQFLLGMYHDLPNVLFAGSLILGSITGYLPLVWVSVGLIFNGLSVAVLQGLLGLIINPLESFGPQVFLSKGHPACEIMPKGKYGEETGTNVIAPSYWLTSAIFFATFTIYNSVRVAMIPSVKGANPEKADIRQAFTLTTIVIGAVFLLLIMGRGFSGCESYFGGGLSLLIGSGLAIGYWHLLNVCGAGMVPDVLQVVNSMAPPGEDTVPVVCSA
jgi:magnesium-transporting ATPase (P-type)